MPAQRSSLLFIALLTLLLPATVSAQSAQDVLQNMAEAYETRIQHIDDFTVVTAMEGSMQMVDSITTYYKKVQQDGHTAFETTTKMHGGLADVANRVSGASPGTGANDPLAMNQKFVELFSETAQYEGTETVDGEKVHVVFIEDLSPLYQEMMDEDDAEAMQARDARLYVDTNQWVLRKMTMDMTVGKDKEARTMKTTTRMEDYREVGSLLYPYRVTTIMENPMSAEQRAKMEKQMAEMEKQMAQLPEAQRKQVEKMMGSRMKKSMEKMQEDTIEMVMVTKDVKVNTGMPAGMASN